MLHYSKIAYAHQFATETVINQEDLVYTTETDLLEQEANNSAQIDAEWQRRIRFLMPEPFRMNSVWCNPNHF